MWKDINQKSPHNAKNVSSSTRNELSEKYKSKQSLWSKKKIGSAIWQNGVIRSLRPSSELRSAKSSRSRERINKWNSWETKWQRRCSNSIRRWTSCMQDNFWPKKTGTCKPQTKRLLDHRRSQSNWLTKQIGKSSSPKVSTERIPGWRLFISCSKERR